MYILACPNCGEKDDIAHYGNHFNCNNCNETTYLEDMDFEYKEDE